MLADQITIIWESEAKCEIMLAVKTICFPSSFNSLIVLLLSLSFSGISWPLEKYEFSCVEVVLSLISVVNKDSSRVNLVLILDNRSLPTCSN